MTNDQEQLIRSITERVLAELRGRGGGGGVRGDDAGPAAVVRPPIGVCTGDYSKFPELRGRQVGAALSAIGGRRKPYGDRPPSAVRGGNGVGEAKVVGRASLNLPSPDERGARRAQPRATVPHSKPGVSRSERGAVSGVLTGFVTARQLEGLAGGVARLAAGARLTPLAADYVKEKRLTVERVGEVGERGGGSPAGSGRPDRWLWWVDGHCRAVEQMMGPMRERLSPISQRRVPSGVGPAVRDLSRAVHGGRAAGGVLFVHSASRAACFANRCDSLRAVVGTCGEAVEEGIRLLGANVLIVEYPHHGPAGMRGMVERFVDAERPGLGDVERQLRELRSEGVGGCV